MSGLDRVRVTRYVTPLREGGSLPGIVEGDDLGTYVCKFRGAGQGLRVLVAEVVVGELARRIGLRTPRLVVLDLDPAIARYEADEEVQDLLDASAGDNLGIDFLPGAFGYTDDFRADGADEAARVLWLDAFCANVDRSWRNPNLLVWGDELWVIDHGAALYFHHAWPGGVTDPARFAAQPWDPSDHVLLERASEVLAGVDEIPLPIDVENETQLTILDVGWEAGQLLATVESNESLQTYAVTAPISGLVTQRAANPGEATGERALFVISDYASVWAELTVFPRDRARLQAGQAVKITAADAHQSGEGRIGAIAAAEGGGPTLVARVPLDNARGQWTPGQFVTAEVVIGESPVPLAVPNVALQPFRDFTVVFAQVGETYEARMLELGRSDGEMTEVLGGIKPGTRYVSANSYLVKADIEKSGASHDH